MIEFLADPRVWITLLVYWIFSAAVGALPTPRVGGTMWYEFLFRFAHGLSGNLSRAAVALKVPGSSTSTDPALAQPNQTQPPIDLSRPARPPRDN